MRLSRRHLATRCCVALLTGIFAAGCGNNCFVGFSGTGFIVKAQTGACGNPPIAVKLNVVVSTLRLCDKCNPPSSIEHLFVTIKGVQLRSTGNADTNPSAWVELAPELAREPRQIDLMGEGSAQALVQNASVAVGTYSAARVQFASDSQDIHEELAAGSACKSGLRNCIVMGDERESSLAWPPDNRAEIIVPFANLPGHALALLSSSTTELQLNLEPHIAVSSSAQGFQTHSTLSATIDFERQSANR
jgi:hypothetical protein